MSVWLYCYLSYPACKAHLFCAALYRHMRPAWLYHICPQYLINGTILKQDIQCAYSLILRRVSVTIVAVENQYYIFCVCAYNLNHLACKAHAPYCPLWPVWLYHIYSFYLINGTIFRKKLWNRKCMFWFSLRILSETFLILRRIQRDIIINIHRSSCKVLIILVRFWWNFNFLNRFSKNRQTWNLMKIRPVGTKLFHAERRADRQTHIHDETVVFSQFCECT
jgi:hypothetical protein